MFCKFPQGSVFVELLVNETAVALQTTVELSVKEATGCGLIQTTCGAVVVPNKHCGLLEVSVILYCPGSVY